jgi:hypothetical protein
LSEGLSLGREAYAEVVGRLVSLCDAIGELARA